MSLALREAEKGLARVSPNPLVGAVVVKNHRVIAKGAHLDFGGPHAEVHALRRAGARARGATLYVSLEPCSTFGKTPPCTHAIVQAGVKRVVAACRDPNPRHRGKGFALLRHHGIRVTESCLEREARELNRGFFTWVREKRPYVVLKLAQTLDGKIATRTGDSRWVSARSARRLVQDLRKRTDAILVGSGTVLRDNPRLSVRASRRQPAVVLLDARLRVPLTARVLADRSRIRLVVAGRVAKHARMRYFARGVDLLELARGRRIPLRDLLAILAQVGLTSLLVEGGGETAAGFLEEGLVDRLFLFIAPKLAGGRSAPTSFEGEGCARMRDCIHIPSWQLSRVGGDLLFTADLTSRGAPASAGRGSWPSFPLTGKPRFHV